MFRRSPRQWVSQASARVPTRHAGVRAPQWIHYFAGVVQKLSDIAICHPASRVKISRRLGSFLAVLS